MEPKCKQLPQAFGPLINPDLIGTLPLSYFRAQERRNLQTTFGRVNRISQVQQGRAFTAVFDGHLSVIGPFDFTCLSCHPARMRVPVMAGLLITSGLMVLGAGQVPDFKLTDANPNSVRFGTSVSPRDYLLQVSGYYFGFAG